MRLRLAWAMAVLMAGRCLAADVSVQQVEQALARAVAGIQTVATEGGYLWRYSEDLAQRWGEETATATQIWVQPPGTPSVGMALLRAHAATKDPRCLEAAQKAALALAWGQLESGGWDYRIDFSPRASQRVYRRDDRGRIDAAEAAKRRNTSTFDDDNTQSALRFLMAFVEATRDADTAEVRRVREALDYGLAKMIEAQYPNGAWPQRWNGQPRQPDRFPVKRASIPVEYPRQYARQDYTGHYTLNDHTQRDCILTMLAAHKQFKRPEYLASAKKGGGFLVLAQLPEPQAAWAQQYNPEMQPAWARAFEPPAVCAGESAGVIRTLVDLYLETGDEAFLKPIPAAIEWYNRSALRPNIWARFYELTTNRPIYGDRDGKIHYRLDEISAERQRGYSWESAYGVPTAIAYYRDVLAAGRDAYLQQRARAAPNTGRRVNLAAQAQQVIGALDARGLWVVDGQIQTRTFIQNLNVLCHYLEAR